MKSTFQRLLKRPTVTLSQKEFIALFAMMMSLTALSMDAVLPAFRGMAESLSVTNHQSMQWVVSSLIAGMVFGELLFGPLSDAIGRKRAILIGVGIYIVGCVIAMAANSLETLLLGRFIQGFGVAGPKIASRALIRDLHKGAAMARIMSYVMVIFILVPMLAPSFGQLVLLVGSWHWIFAALIFQALMAAIWLSARQPETLSLESRQPMNWQRIYRDGRAILSRKEVLCYTGMVGLIFGGLMLYLGMSQSIFQDLYHTGDAFPLYFAIMAAGAGLASFTNGRIVVRFGMQRLVTFALTVKLSAALLMTLAALLLDGVPPLWLFLCLGVPIFFSMGLLFGNINAMAMEPLGRMAGLGASLISSLSSLIAVVVSVLVGAFYNFTVMPLALGYVIFTGVACVLLRKANQIKANTHATPETPSAH